MLAIGMGFMIWASSQVGINSVGNTLIVEYGESLGPLYLIVFSIGSFVSFYLIFRLISRIFSIETEDEEYFRIELKKLRKEKRKSNSRVYKKIRILKVERKLELLKD